MKINGKTRLLGVMGNPIEHTVSPIIHNNLAQALNDDIVYTAFRVEEENVGEAVKGAYALDMLGMNVTVPHKSAVIPFLKEIDPLAERIGAVNTLVRCEGGFKGYNTDMPGLLRAMKYDGADFKGEYVIILGAGGVARAVAMMLADNGAAHIIIMNRSLDKARALADEINAYVESSLGKGDGGLHNSKDFCLGFDLPSYVNLSDDRKYVVIQATSVGMYPKNDEVIIEDESFYKKISIGYDIVFNPLETKFMKLCKESGAKSFGGLRMLLYQGIIAYELWTGREVSDDLSDQIYAKMLEAMN